jgi:hypothetical protein
VREKEKWQLRREVERGEMLGKLEQVTFAEGSWGDRR